MVIRLQAGLTLSRMPKQQRAISNAQQSDRDELDKRHQESHFLAALWFVHVLPSLHKREPVHRLDGDSL